MEITIIKNEKINVELLTDNIYVCPEDMRLFCKSSLLAEIVNIKQKNIDEKIDSLMELAPLAPILYYYFVKSSSHDVYLITKEGLAYLDFNINDSVIANYLSLLLGEFRAAEEKISDML